MTFTKEQLKEELTKYKVEFSPQLGEKRLAGLLIEQYRKDGLTVHPDLLTQAGEAVEPAAQDGAQSGEKKHVVLTNVKYNATYYAKDTAYALDESTEKFFRENNFIK